MSPHRNPAKALVSAKIEAAKEAITDAEKELGKVIGQLEATPRAEKALVSKAVRAGLSRLKAAEGKLVALERLAAPAKIEIARLAIVEAEAALDRSIEEIISARQEKTWMSEIVGDAFAKLEAAKKKLVELEECIPTDDD